MNATNDMISSHKVDVLCACSGTTKTQIRRQLAKGVDDLDGISRATGACSGCGACEPEVSAFIAECLAEEQ